MTIVKTDLQKMRKRAGYKSAKVFAEKIGMSVDTYTAYEQGKTSISLLKAWELADVLGCTLDELAGRKSPYGDETITQEEKRIINAYRSTDERGKSNILLIAENQSGMEGESSSGAIA